MTSTSLTLTAPALDPAGDPLGPLLLAEDRAGEPVAGVVGESQRLLGVAHLHHADDGAEGLVAHHLHRVVDVDQHRRFEVVAWSLDPLAAGQRLGAGGERVIDVVVDDRALVGRGHRADVLVGSRRRRRPGAAADLVGQLRHELVVGRLLDVDPLDRDADLAGVHHPAPGRGVGGAVEIGVGEDDHRVLAAELEADRGQRLRRPRHHLAPGAIGAGELDEVDVVDQRAAGLADPLHAVEHVGAADLLLPGLRPPRPGPAA